MPESVHLLRPVVGFQYRTVRGTGYFSGARAAYGYTILLGRVVQEDRQSFQTFAHLKWKEIKLVLAEVLCVAAIMTHGFLAKLIWLRKHIYLSSNPRNTNRL